MAFRVFLFVAFVLLFLVSHNTKAQELQTRPNFLAVPTLVQSNVGGTAQLSCAISNLGSRQVIWQKYPEDDPLAEGTQIPEVANGHRMSADIDTDFGDQTTVYNLTITDVTDDDDGYYHCAVLDENNVHDSPYYVRLLVGDIIEQASVGLSGTHYAALNGLILLTCLNPTGGTDIPDWFKSGNHVTASYDPHVHLQQWEAQENRGAASAIIIQNARMSDTGTYVCRGAREENRVSLHSIKVIVLTPDVLDSL